MSRTLQVGTVAAYLIERGLVPAGEPVKATELGGGVSSVVLDVRTRDRRLVVKQPLDAFRVPERWVVKRERVLVEAAALELGAGILPGAVPAVIDLDRERLVVVLEGAPPGSASWKERLLEGDADPGVAERLGLLLAAWHRATRRPELLARFDDPEIFGQQRTEPYYRTTMQRRPDIAGPMAELLDRLLATHVCLVHGDWSPKNVLTSVAPSSSAVAGHPSGHVWVIDWEITHAGDPAFDVAFMTNHLMLKAIHVPDARDRFAECAHAFWSAYGTVADVPYVLGHVGCLMAARVDGRSPAEYLTPDGAAAARDLARSLVLDPPGSLDAAWERL